MQRQLKAPTSGSDLGSGQFHFLVILTRHFDMVAEQGRRVIIWCIQLVSRLITSKTDTSKTTIASSSGKERRFKWNFHFRERAEVNMFAHDHRRNPRVLQPTSFDGTQPSFMKWSEEIIAFLAVTDDQKFIPLLTAAASSKDVIQADVMFTGVLSDTIEKIKKNNDDLVRKEADRTKNQAENKV